MNKEIDLTKIKFLPVSPEDLALALDRLTRFKYPEIKYYRVFSELLCKYFIEPKLSKKDVFDMDTMLLNTLSERLWNDSVSKHVPNTVSDFSINAFLLDELNKTYIISDEMQKFVDLHINIDGVLELISDIENCPVNIKRLILLKNNFTKSLEFRKKFSLKFPVEKVVLCEGITEEILLPKFSALAGYDFDKQGVKLISAGGKNQVAKLYCELKDELKIPIFILLDADATEIANKLKNVLRASDSLYLIKLGEFEDIFSLNLIKRTINKRFKNICECSISDFKHNAPMTKILSEFYRLNELGDFQKSDFAKELAINLKYKSDLTDEILLIIDKIKTIY